MAGPAALLFSIDWEKVFVPTRALEVALRGTMVYLTIFTILRVVLKRETGNVGITDVLMIVLIAEAAQNSMTGQYESYTDGMVLVSTIVFWNFTLDWVAFRFPRLRHLIHPPPLPLIKDGRFLSRNMRKEFITEDELVSHLREEGIESPSQVKSAFMESDGRISVVPKE